MQAIWISENVWNLKNIILKTFQSVLRSLRTKCLWASQDGMFIAKKQTTCSAEASNSVENTRFLSIEEKDSRRKSFYAKRDATKVNLLQSFYRWRTLRNELQLSKDKQLADFQINFYICATN